MHSAVHIFSAIGNDDGPMYDSSGMQEQSCLGLCLCIVLSFSPTAATITLHFARPSNIAAAS